MNATLPGDAAAIAAEPVGQLRVPRTLHDQPRAASQQIRRRRGQQVEPLLRIEPADHADDRAVIVGREPDPGQQVRPAARLPAELAPPERRRQIGIRGRDPRPWCRGR